MERIILVRTLGGWKTVPERDARLYARLLLRNAVAVPAEKRRKFVNENKIRGITCEELGV